MQEVKVKEEDEKEFKDEKAPTKEDKTLPMFSDFEGGVYISIWIIGYVYTLWVTYSLTFNKHSRKYFIKHGILVKDNFLGLYMSILLTNNWSGVVKNLIQIKPCLVYMAIAMISRRMLNSKHKLIVTLVASISIILYYSSLSYLMKLIGIYLFFSLLSIFRSRILIWIMALVILHYFSEILNSYEYFTELQGLSHSFLYFSIIRGVTVGLWFKSQRIYNLKMFLSTLHYHFYFPSILDMKFMTIKDFIEQIEKPVQEENYLKWLKTFVKLLVYFIIWHVVYCHTSIDLILEMYYLKDTPHVFNIFSFYHVGITHYMGAFVIIEISYLIMKMDGFETARGPSCIVPIALYSRQWREFDKGLHFWIKENIFRPISYYGSHQIWRHVAAFASFGFVWIYFSKRLDAALYLIINFSQHLLESWFSKTYNKSNLKQYIIERFSPITEKRIIGFIWGFSFIFSSIGYGSLYSSYESTIGRIDAILFNKSKGQYIRIVTYLMWHYVFGCMCLFVKDKILQKNKLKSD